MLYIYFKGKQPLHVFTEYLITWKKAQKQEVQ